MPENNECVCCGRIIPEGTMICLQCGYADDMQTFRPKIVTNGDRIRSMTDEQIAEMLDIYSLEEICDYCTEQGDPSCHHKCYKGILAWLRKEAT